ncbi:translation initiation factor IF-2-like [Pollicipes pollicipes]|uniref:translation initiation factor IF-2-like n=1 Tax=Pollicipes pollicipes TaxID=41117 RepID=UPI0018856921|nr:translation initiation factor IF-2-like [Pollicipes pollicipes]
MERALRSPPLPPPLPLLPLLLTPLLTLLPLPLAAEGSQEPCPELVLPGKQVGILLLVNQSLNVADKCEEFKCQRNPDTRRLEVVKLSCGTFLTIPLPGNCRPNKRLPFPDCCLRPKCSRKRRPRPSRPQATPAPPKRTRPTARTTNRPAIVPTPGATPLPTPSSAARQGGAGSGAAHQGRQGDNGETQDSVPNKPAGRQNGHGLLSPFISPAKTVLHSNRTWNTEPKPFDGPINSIIFRGAGLPVANATKVRWFSVATGGPWSGEPHPTAQPKPRRTARRSFAVQLPTRGRSPSSAAGSGRPRPLIGGRPVSSWLLHVPLTRDQP